MKWTDEPPTQDGYYFVRYIYLSTGKICPTRPPVQYICADVHNKNLAWYEQEIAAGRLIPFTREQYAGPIPEPEE